MKIATMKLAQALPDHSSNVLFEADFDMTFEGGYFTVVPKKGKLKDEALLIFSSNVAYAKPCKDAPIKIRKAKE